MDADKSGLQEALFSDTIIDMKIQNVTGDYLKIATPKEGAIIYEEGYRMGLHGKKVKIADWLHNTLGGDIMLLNEGGNWNKKTPDFIWNGKEWELKSISSAKAADSALKKY